ncbi:MAG: hypothetical protein HUK20_10175 [Fibrobacter sp.]|nr:hypothetical protein [Fibrobacter sp.]
MKFLKFALLAAGAALVGCAGNQQAMDRSINRAENTKAYSEESKVDPLKVTTANNLLDSAKTLQADGEEVLAMQVADLSALEYKLSMLNARNEALKGENAKIEADIKADEQRKTTYQGVLDRETKGAK